MADISIEPNNANDNFIQNNEQVVDFTDLPRIHNEPPTAIGLQSSDSRSHEIVVDEDGATKEIVTTSTTAKKGQKTRTLITKVTTKTSATKVTTKSDEPVQNTQIISTKTVTKGNGAIKPASQASGGSKPKTVSTTTKSTSDDKATFHKTSEKKPLSTKSDNGKDIPKITSEATKNSGQTPPVNLTTSSKTSSSKSSPAVKPILINSPAKEVVTKTTTIKTAKLETKKSGKESTTAMKPNTVSAVRKNPAEYTNTAKSSISSLGITKDITKSTTSSTSKPLTTKADPQPSKAEKPKTTKTPTALATSATKNPKVKIATGKLPANSKGDSSAIKPPENIPKPATAPLKTPSSTSKPKVIRASNATATTSTTAKTTTSVKRVNGDKGPNLSKKTSQVKKEDKQKMWKKDQLINENVAIPCPTNLTECTNDNIVDHEPVGNQKLNEQDLLDKEASGGEDTISEMNDKTPDEGGSNNETIIEREVTEYANILETAVLTATSIQQVESGPVPFDEDIILDIPIQAVESNPDLSVNAEGREMEELMEEISGGDVQHMETNPIESKVSLEQINHAGSPKKQISFEGTGKITSADFDLYCVTPIDKGQLYSDNEHDSPMNSPVKPWAPTGLEFSESKDDPDDSTPLSDAATYGTDRPSSQYLSPSDETSSCAYEEPAEHDTGGIGDTFVYSDDNESTLNGNTHLKYGVTQELVADENYQQEYDVTKELTVDESYQEEYTNKETNEISKEQENNEHVEISTDLERGCVDDWDEIKKREDYNENEEVADINNEEDTAPVLKSNNMQQDVGVRMNNEQESSSHEQDETRASETNKEQEIDVSHGNHAERSQNGNIDEDEKLQCFQMEDIQDVEELRETTSRLGQEKEQPINAWSATTFMEKEGQTLDDTSHMEDNFYSHEMEDHVDAVFFEKKRIDNNLSEKVLTNQASMLVHSDSTSTSSFDKMSIHDFEAESYNAASSPTYDDDTKKVENVFEAETTAEQSTEYAEQEDNQGGENLFDLGLQEEESGQNITIFETELLETTGISQRTTNSYSTSNGTILMGEYASHQTLEEDCGGNEEDGDGSEISEEQDSPNHHVMIKQSVLDIETVFNLEHRIDDYTEDRNSKTDVPNDVEENEITF